MKSFLKKHSESFAKSAGLIAIGVIIAAGASVLAYTAPTGPAPSGNVAAPVNTSAFAQTKLGDLTIGNPGDVKILKVNSHVLAVAGAFNSVVGGRSGSFTDDAAAGLFRLFSAGTPAANTNQFLEAGKVDSAGNITSGLRVNNNGTSTTVPLVEIKNTTVPTSTVMNLFKVQSGTGAFNVFTSGGLNNFTDRTALLASVEGNLSVNKEIRVGTTAPASGVLAAKGTDGIAQWQTLNSENSVNGLIYTRRESSTGNQVAQCLSGDIAIGGGGDCEYGIRVSQPVNSNGSALSDGFHNSTSPNNIDNIIPTGWSVQCLLSKGGVSGTATGLGNVNGIAHAQVICMKNTNIATGLSGATTPPVNTPPVNPPVTTGPWYDAPVGVEGTTGASCAAYMTKVGIALNKSVIDIRGEIYPVQTSTGSCAVVYTGNVTTTLALANNTTNYVSTCSRSDLAPSNPNNYSFKVVPSCTMGTLSVKTELKY